MKISENCYVIYGLTTLPPWMVNAGIIAGKEKTLIVDCGGNYLSAQTIYGYAKSISPANELIAINTEPHFDHMGGNCFFKEMGIDIYGHSSINRTDEELEATKKEYAECITSVFRKHINEEELVFYKTYTANPSKKVTNDFTINLGGIDAEIILSPGHTKMNLSVFVPEEKILFCGDTIITGYVPNLEDGDKNDWETWLSSIDKLMQKQPEIIVPGHGEAITGVKVDEEISRMKHHINEAISKGKPPAIT